jgi:SAM-dependent methyltransferase
MKEYYEQRAPEFDDWYLTRGLFEGRDRPGWDEELAQLLEVVGALPPARVLDAACGTGFLTRHHRGRVVGLDQSAAMLGIARGRVPDARFVRADALALPFPDESFDRVFTGHFYGHLLPEERARFLTQALWVALELVVVDAGVRGGAPRDEWQERRLNDGSCHPVFKRFFTGESLAAELGGGRVLHEGTWFVVVASTAEPAQARSPAGREGWGE